MNKFNLDDVQQAAGKLLADRPDPIVAYRLQREVLRLPDAHPELTRVKQAALTSRWVQALQQAQLPDGSFGRFHSQDTRVKTIFRTTEEAIDRAFALGMDRSDAVLARTRQYILQALHGEAQITDRQEQAESWPLLIKFILAGRLAQVDPGNSELDSYWSYLAEVAEQAFSSGIYRLDNEVAAYQRLSGLHVPAGFLESQHALWILSSRRLSEKLDRSLVEWIWAKLDGIRYIRVPLLNPKPRQMGYWIKSNNILSRFESWHELSTGMLNQCWEKRDERGLWDFGPDTAGSVEFPLSESWRRSLYRCMDYSTSLLALLRKFFD
jgi:hypothetical protein